MKLTRIAVDNPVFATMTTVALLVMGLFSSSPARRRPVPEHRLPGRGGDD